MQTDEKLETKLKNLLKQLIFCARCCFYKSANYFYRHQVLVHAIGDLRWKIETINTEFAESTVVNVLMVTEGSR